MIDTTPVIVFARLKPNENCLSVIRKSKRFTIVWHNGFESIITMMEKTFYECEHNFLIKHPFLSCFTEIQLIKLKPEFRPYEEYNHPEQGRGLCDVKFANGKQDVAFWDDKMEWVMDSYSHIPNITHWRYKS